MLKDIDLGITNCMNRSSNKEFFLSLFNYHLLSHSMLGVKSLALGVYFRKVRMMTLSEIRQNICYLIIWNMKAVN